MNEFFNILYFVLISLSFSVMWNFSDIFSPLRNIVSRIPYIRKPMTCPECSSFWFGFFSSFLYNPVVLDFNIFLLSNVLCGLITHLFAFFLFNKKKSVDNSLNFLK